MPNIATSTEDTGQGRSVKKPGAKFVSGKGMFRKGQASQATGKIRVKKTNKIMFARAKVPDKIQIVTKEKEGT